MPIEIQDTTPAKGKIVNFGARGPTQEGKQLNFHFHIKNVGGETGSFFPKVYEGDELLYSTGSMKISPGEKFWWSFGPIMPRRTLNLTLVVMHGEVVDDTKDFTIELAYLPVTCCEQTPHFANGYELLNHFDSNNDGLISPEELTSAIESYDRGEITTPELDFVIDALSASSISEMCPESYGITEGNITSVTYPTDDVVHGTPFDVHVEFENVGERIGIFFARLVIDDVVKYVSGDTTPEVGSRSIIELSAVSPESGTSMYVEAQLLQRSNNNSLDSERSFTIGLVEPTPVTCDGGSPNYGTGCELLNHFDSNNDDLISPEELASAIESYDRGEITIEELAFIKDAEELELIENTCPECYTPPPSELDLEEILPVAAGALGLILLFRKIT